MFMKKIFIALLLALLIGCEPNGIQTTEHTSLLTSVDTSIEQTTTQVTTTQVTTTASIISPNDYIDGIHISSYWYSVMDEDEKWGFVDLDGDIIIPFICDEPATFENGTAIVNIRGLKGVINFLGNNVLVPRFAEIESLNHGLFYATSLNEEDFVIYDNEGNQVFSVAGIDSYISLNSDSVLGYKIGSSYGLISVEGDIITDTIFDRIQPFHEDIAAVEVNNLWDLSTQKVNIR